MVKNTSLEKIIDSVTCFQQEYIRIQKRENNGNFSGITLMNCKDIIHFVFSDEQKQFGFSLKNEEYFVFSLDSTIRIDLPFASWN